MKHTQGEWQVKADNSVTPKDNVGTVIAQICSANNNEEEAQANAALIAAAPELLKALNSLLHCPDLNLCEIEIETREAIDIAANAVHKATNVNG